MIDTTLRRKFELGEKKYVDFRVTSHKVQAVVIEGADYTLTRGGQIVATGPCKIDGEYISAFIAPSEAGSYILEIRFTVPPVHRKVKVIIDVS